MHLNMNEKHAAFFSGYRQSDQIINSTCHGVEYTTSAEQHVIN